MRPNYRAFFGPQHKFYALAAAAVGLGIVLLDLARGLTPEQFTRGFAVFLMMYFAGTVAGLAYGPEDVYGRNRLASIYWRFGRLPYFTAAIAGLAHIVLFTDQSALILHVGGLLAASCLVPALFLKLRLRGEGP